MTGHERWLVMNVVNDNKDDHGDHSSGEGQGAGGGRWMSPRWSEAMSRARVLSEQCRRAAGGGGGQTSPVWGLVVYAVAAQEQCSSAEVTVAQCRYRVHDLVDLTVWLWATLAQLGHQVPRPTMPPVELGAGADWAAAVTLLQLIADTTSPAADDPVTREWLRATAITSGTTEMTDGTTVNDPPECPLWRVGAGMRDELDVALVLQRGGWQNGARVRVRGLPPHITMTSDPILDVPVAGNRAVVQAPVWRLDHDRHTLADGPPAHYRLRYRALDTGLPSTPMPSPVDAGHLAVDLAPITELNPELNPEPSAEPAPPVDAPDRMATHEPVDERGGDERSDDERGGDERGDCLGELELRDLQADLRRVIPANRPGLPRAVAATDDAVRVAAIMRVWRLRDAELQVGDSAPRQVAERITKGNFPAPLPPYTFDELASHAEIRQNVDERPGARLKRAPGYPPDQQVVTGEPREQLRQWLEAMRSCTRAQIRALDGFDGEATVAQVHAVLAGEGFVEIARTSDTRAHTRADTSLEDGQGDSVEEDGYSSIWVCREMGWLAVVEVDMLYSLVTRTQTLRPDRVRIYHNTRAVDEDLMLTTGDLGSFHQEHGRRTPIMYGSVIAYPRQYYPASTSLRVKLAALRAFGTPVTPWTASPDVWIGLDSTPMTVQHHVLLGLPQDVHDLLGPKLLHPL